MEARQGETMREPRPGEIQIAVLLGGATFIAWAPHAEMDALATAFERRAGVAPGERGDRVVQAGLRARIARDLRTPQGPALFQEVLAAGCLWLALNHWSGGAEMREGLTRQIAETDRAVLTASIADPAPEGSHPDTAWGFMVGSRVHDGRDEIARLAPGEARLLTR